MSKLRVEGDNIKVGRYWLHNRKDPVGYAEEWVQGLHYTPHSLIVMFGLGLGHEMKALLKRMQPHDKLVIVEPDTRVLEECRKYNPEMLTMRRQIYRVKNWTEFKQVMMQIGDWEYIIVCAMPQYVKLYPDLHREFIEKVNREMNNLQADAATTEYFARIWQVNVLKNLSSLKKVGSLSAGIGKWKGKPAIIVSAGPSLTENLPLLDECKGKALILATQTTNRVFASREVKPDLVFSFDGDFPNYYEHFKEVELDVPLVFDPTIHPRCIHDWKGDLCMMLVHPANAWIEEVYGTKLTGFNSGPSIANTLLDVAWSLGSDPIIFIGQDLAYTGGRFHAADTHRSEVWDASIPPERQLKKVKSYDGEDLITDRNMMTYLHWFEEMLSIYYPLVHPNDKRKVINATGAGAAIRGMEPMSFREAIDAYVTQENPVAEFVDSLTVSIGTGSEMKEYLKEARNILDEVYHKVYLSAQASEKLVHAYNRMSQSQRERVFIGMSETDDALIAQKKYLHIIHYVIRATQVTLERPLDPVREDILVAEATKKLYNNLKTAMEFGLGLLEEVTQE